MGRAAVVVVQNDNLVEVEEGVKRSDVPQHGADPAGYVPEGDALEPLQAQDRVRVGARVQAGYFRQVASVIWGASETRTIVMERAESNVPTTTCGALALTSLPNKWTNGGSGWCFAVAYSLESFIS